MNDQRTAPDRDARIENFAAELTSAVYPLVLRRGLKAPWITVELGLWKALTETIVEWARYRPPALRVPASPTCRHSAMQEWAAEFEAWRKGLLWALTGSAFAVARNNIIGPRPEVEARLYKAFRRVIWRHSHVS